MKECFRTVFLGPLLWALLGLLLVGINGCNDGGPLTTDNRNVTMRLLIPATGVTILREENGTAYAVAPLNGGRYAIRLIQSCAAVECKSPTGPSDKLFKRDSYTLLTNKAGQKFAVRNLSQEESVGMYEIQLVNDAVDKVLEEQEQENGPDATGTPAEAAPDATVVPPEHPSL